MTSADHEEGKAALQVETKVWMQVSREGPAADHPVNLRQSLQKVHLETRASMCPLDEPYQHSALTTFTVPCSKRTQAIHSWDLWATRLMHNVQRKA